MFSRNTKIKNGDPQRDSKRGDQREARGAAQRDAQRDAQRGDHGAFPGGRTKLPRISSPGVRRNANDADPIHGPDVQFVDSAFRKGGTATLNGTNAQRVTARGDDTQFGQYYSAESLFESPREMEVTPTSDGPYAVLGLTRQASWEQIRRAHRALVSSLHPDRYVGAEPTVIEHAERRVRDINEAFAEIRRQRSGSVR